MKTSVSSRDVAIRTYRFSPDAVKRRLRQTTQSGVAFFLAFLLPFLWIFGRSFYQHHFRVPLPDLVVMASALLVFTAITALGLRFSLRPAKKRLSSFELEVGPNSIVRKQADSTDLEIRGEEITYIEEKKSRLLFGRSGLLILTANPYKFIFVDADLDSYYEAKTLLSAWIKSRSQARKHLSLMTIGKIAAGVELILFIIERNAARANDWLLASLARVGIQACMLWGLYHVGRSPETPQRHKRLIWALFAAFFVTLLVAIYRFTSRV